MNANKIQMIALQMLNAHKDNPRKQLGDLTELTDSIKQNGIMQNLTVVPSGEAGSKKTGYTIIIGHRRAAAAKAAGLKEVPCVITHMSYKKQLSIMLLENIQRNDLTVQEQAEGFQMMLNLGATVGEIARETGFSQATVKHRLEIAKLDKTKLLNALDGRQVSLGEFAKLEELKNIEARERLLKYIGTSEFNYKLQSEKHDEYMNEFEAAVLPTLEKFAKPFSKSDTSYFSLSVWKKVNSKADIKNFSIPTDTEKFEYKYRTTYESIEIYKIERVSKEDKQKAKENKEKEKAKKEREKENKQRYDEISKRCYETRAAFISSFDVKSVTIQDITKFVNENILIALTHCYMSARSARKILGLELTYAELTESEIKAIGKKYSIRQLEMIGSYALSGDSELNSAHDYEGRYNKAKAEKLRHTYDALKILKYEMSQEEKDYVNGKIFLRGNKV